MEAMYIEELKSSVNQLMANLESMPVSKGGEFKLQKLKRGHNTSIIDMGQEDENQLSKSDVVLSFTLEVPIFNFVSDFNKIFSRVQLLNPKLKLGLYLGFRNIKFSFKIIAEHKISSLF